MTRNGIIKWGALVASAAALWPTVGHAQSDEALSAWQVEKCQIYTENWHQALDFFGTDNLNYNFVAQNENFIASDCTAPASVCAQSSQEYEIANALTLAMMNAGAASTFLPFRCEAAPAMAPATDTAEALLCRAQLDLLLRGNKLTEAEASVYEAQCACLERSQGAGAPSDCAQ